MFKDSFTGQTHSFEERFDIIEKRIEDIENMLNFEFGIDTAYFLYMNKVLKPPKQISLCKNCHCMTHTVGIQCGKCGAKKHSLKKGRSRSRIK